MFCSSRGFSGSIRLLVWSITAYDRQRVCRDSLPAGLEFGCALILTKRTVMTLVPHSTAATAASRIQLSQSAGLSERAAASSGSTSLSTLFSHSWRFGSEEFVCSRR